MPKTADEFREKIAEGASAQSIIQDLTTASVGMCRDGSSLLYYAAEAGYLEVCEFLIEEKRMPVRDGKKLALSGAILSANPEIVSLMLKNGAVVNESCLDSSVPRTPMKTLKEMLKNNPDDERLYEIQGLLERYKTSEKDRDVGKESDSDKEDEVRSPMWLVPSGGVAVNSSSNLSAGANSRGVQLKYGKA